ncbi:MAG TPA: bifunctional aspartate kinase/diaminopimelate decarboxylase, partial [Pseudomonadota bacterium]|nr:bifunctional aspartate kinase/diaminopimelate decarboxylase [Pseudomonadota bacterium]
MATAARWRTIADLARARVEAGFGTVIVVSAVSGLTNRLQSLIDRELSPAELSAETDAIRALHQQLMAELNVAPPAATLAWLDHLAALAQQAPERRRDFRWQAELLSMGELISSSLGAAYLASTGLRCGWLDSRQWLKAEPRPNQSDWARWLSVSCATQGDPARVAELAAQADCFVAPGFMGSDADGATCILGR